MTTTTATLDTLLAGDAAAPETIAMAADAVRSMVSGRGAGAIELVVLEGELWVTMEGDPQDHILRAGEVFAPEWPGRVAWLALRPARLLVRRVSRKAA